MCSVKSYCWDCVLDCAVERLRFGSGFPFSFIWICDCTWIPSSVMDYVDILYGNHLATSLQLYPEPGTLRKEFSCV